jgi:hypothetical protein
MSICLNMIVKNESAIIRSTLENLTSYVKFAYWVICDTGSTDGTQDIIKNFFKEKNISGELFQDEWKDFGHNRSLALQRAYESKKADYVLIFDADDAFRGTFKIPTLDKDRYSCKFGYGSDFTWYRPVILNNRIKWKYFGVLHEYVDCIEPNYNPVSIHVDGDYYIEARTIGGDRNKDDKKYQKDALLLEKALETEKDEGLRARYAFYCGQSFRDCGDLPNAIKYYLMRTKMGFFDEEVHVSYYNVGKMMVGLNYPEQEVEKTFLDGWNYMKDRSECLYELSKYYRLKGNYIKGYTYGQLGRKIPYPSHRVLFLHRDVYDWRIHDETAISAYYIGKHDEAIKYNQIVLQHHFDERVLNNIRFSMKEVISKVVQPPNRTINVSKHRPLGLTFVLRFQQNIDLIKLTMNSLFHFIRDAYKLERFLILIEANKTKEIEAIRKDYPFFEVITWKHKSHMIPNLKNALGRKDRFLFYIEESWIFTTKRNYLNKSLIILSGEQKYGQYLFNRGGYENMDDYNKKTEGNIIYDVEGSQNDKKKYYMNEKHKRLHTSPSLIKREFLDCVSDYDKDIDEDFHVIYQNRIDAVKARKAEK